MQFRMRLLLLLAGLLVVGIAVSSLGQSELPGTFGGTLRVGTPEEIAIWDVHRSTSILIRKFAAHIFEGLFTEGADYRVIPNLAEGYTLSDDQLTYTMPLRRGVLFHNGDEMTAEDVVASLNHWGSYGPMGSMIFEFVDSVEALDDYTVRITLTEPCGFLLSALATARQGAVIYPKEIVDELTATGELLKPTPEQMIGTGPYRFVEFIPDRYTKLVRFEEYSPRTELPNGYGGRRTAYFDEILFVPILDATVRAASVETGEVDFAMSLAPMDYPRLSRNADLVAILGDPTLPSLVFNMGQGPLSNNRKLRQAMLAALNIEDMALAAVGDPALWRIDGSIMWKETAWWSEAGTMAYNVASLEKARQLISESGYQGEPIRVLSALGYPVLYDAAVIAVSQWRKAGINIEHRAVEWGEVTRIRNDPDLWEVYVGSFSFRTDPALLTVIWPDFFNEWVDDYKDELLADFLAASTYEERYAIWEQVQEYVYREVPFIRGFDFFNVDALQKYVAGYLTPEGSPRMPDEFFWNVWFDGK